MPRRESDRAALPPWFHDALLAAHLGAGGGSAGPGPVEDAFVRAAEQSFAGLEQDPEEARRQGAAFRGMADPEWAGPARTMLGTLLDGIVRDSEAEEPRRDAAFLALILLVVLEDGDPAYQRLRRSPRLARSLAARRRAPVSEGEGRMSTLGPGCRPLLLRILASSGGPFEPGVFDLARDVADGVRPGARIGPFLARHRSLLRACAVRLGRVSPGAVDSLAARAPVIGLDGQAYLTLNGSRWVRPRVGQRRDVPVGRVHRSRRARFLARLLYLLEQGISAAESDRHFPQSDAIAFLRGACEEAGGAFRIEGRSPFYRAVGRVRLTADLRAAVEMSLPARLHKE